MLRLELPSYLVFNVDDSQVPDEPDIASQFRVTHLCNTNAQIKSLETVVLQITHGLPVLISYFVYESNMECINSG